MASASTRITVVVPCYRVEAYLGDCLDSILAYEGDDLEVITVDDGSPDGSPALLDEYARRDPRINVVHLAGNGGPGPARNAGLDRATGEYIWFVDADDWLPPGALIAVLDRLAAIRPNVLVVDHAEVFGDALVPRTVADLLGYVLTPTPLIDRPRLLRLAHSPCTKIVRRTLLDELDLRFPPGWYEDVPFSHGLLMAAPSVDVLNRICYCYRQRSAGSTTSSPSMRHFEVFDQYAQLFARVGHANEGFRPELFRAMIDHYLVILGHRLRLPRSARWAFFRRMVDDYTRSLPAGGYLVPRGLQGVKHRLVRHDAYPAYAVLRLAYRALSRPSPVQRRR